MGNDSQCKQVGSCARRTFWDLKLPQVDMFLCMAMTCAIKTICFQAGVDPNYLIYQPIVINLSQFRKQLINIYSDPLSRLMLSRCAAPRLPALVVQFSYSVLKVGEWQATVYMLVEAESCCNHLADQYNYYND